MEGIDSRIAAAELRKTTMNRDWRIEFGIAKGPPKQDLRAVTV